MPVQNRNLFFIYFGILKSKSRILIFNKLLYYPIGDCNTFPLELLILPKNITSTNNKLLFFHLNLKNTCKPNLTRKKPSISLGLNMGLIEDAMNDVCYKLCTKKLVAL